MAILLAFVGALLIYLTGMSRIRSRVNNFHDTLSESVRVDIINLFRQFRNEIELGNLTAKVAATEFQERAGFIVDRYLGSIYNDTEAVPIQRRIAFDNLIHQLHHRLLREFQSFRNMETAS